MKFLPYYPSSDYNSAIVVPCYNEGKRLDVKKYVNSLDKFSSQVFLVDDGSTDNTFSILKKMERSHPDRFITIKCDKNAGKAEAVRRGLMEALDKNFKKIGFLDADLAVGFDEIPAFIDVFDKNKNVNTVIGVRTRLAGHDIDRTFPKYILQRVIAQMGSLLFSPTVIDTQCGAKMFRSNILKGVLKEKFNVKWIFDQELLTRISKLPENKDKNWLYEYPIMKWKEVGHSHIKISSYLSSLKDYFKLLKIYGIRK